mgnify:CR=1 FL=1
MNRQQAKELLPIIQAFAEGNTIEFRRKDGVAFGINDNWQDYNYMFKSYTFADGTPFGINEE